MANKSNILQELSKLKDVLSRTSSMYSTYINDERNEMSKQKNQTFKNMFLPVQL